MKKSASTQSPEELLTELRTLVTDAEKMIGDSVTETSADAMGALRSRFADAQERLADLYADARDKVVSGAKYTDKAIRANPYQSLAIAAGVGLLAGVLIGRRTAK